MATTMSTIYSLFEMNNSHSILNESENYDTNTSSEAAILELVNKISYGYIMQPICLIGILCNFLNLFVLMHKKLSESPYVYLTGLAIADLLTLILFFLSGFSRAHYPRSYNWKFYEYFIYFTLGGMSTNVSALLTVVLTIERYIFVSFPMKARVICTPRNARKVIVGVLIFAILFDTPRFFAFKINEDISLGYTDFGHGWFYQALNWFRLTVLLLGSCVLLTILNILLIKYVKASTRKRRAVQSHSNLKRIRDNNRLTMMLVAIIGIYIIGEIPSAFVSRAIIVPLLGDKTVHQLSYRIALIIATLLVVLEHSLNFVVYCIYNKKFRGILKAYIIKILSRKTVELTTDNLGETKKPTSISNGLNGNCCVFKENSDEKSFNQYNTEGYTMDRISTNMDASYNVTDDMIFQKCPCSDSGDNDTNGCTDNGSCCVENCPCCDDKGDKNPLCPEEREN